MNTAASVDVIVVGAGFAGIAAARECRQLGLSVIVLEARDRVGGRTWRVPFPPSNTPVELGGTWISRRHHAWVAREIERYGLELEESHAGAVDYRWGVDGAYQPRFPIAGDEMYELEQTWYELMRSARRIDASVPRDHQDLADLDISVRDYLERLPVGNRVRGFMSAFAHLGSGATAADWSALAALSWVAAFDFSVFAWYAAVSEKFAIGTDGVLQAIAEDADAEVRLSTVVTHVTQTRDDIVVTTSSGETFRSGALILAVPINVLSNIRFVPDLSPAKRAIADERHAGAAQKFWVLAERVPANLVSIGWDGDLTWLSTEYSTPDGELLVGFARRPLDLTDLSAVTAAVETVISGAHVKAVTGHDWNTDPFSLGTWTCFRPGQMSRHHSGLQRREGRIAMAGSDTATRWVGWIDGALETAVRAAHEAYELLKGRLEVGF
jgi:monoamine oxidase